MPTLDPLSTPASSRARLRRAKERLFEERVTPAGLVQDAVVRSWERSCALGVRPNDEPLLRETATRASARVIADRARRLIHAVAPEVERVAASMTLSKMCVLCTDAEGMIVHALRHDATAPREMREALRVGRSIAESELGTTAPGCVLVERTPITVLDEEHFIAQVTPFVCAAAPIFHFDGAIAGVLDVSGYDVEFDAATVELVNIAARGSEHRLFAACAPGLHVRVHADPRFLSTPLAGMLAIGEDGRVVGACSGARRSLKLDASRVFMGTPLQDFVDIDYATLRRRLHAGNVAELRTARGTKVFMRLETPERGAVARARARSASLPPAAAEHVFVRDASLRVAIERASLAFAKGISILLRGETGTGKDVLARWLHDTRRPDAPFVAINCAAIPEGRTEAELFGHADGALTGARRGGALRKVAHAEGGTLFLDEIGDMDVRLQARLLHFLQTRTLSRLGEAETSPIDCVIVCATHRDLGAMIADGRFREDLYHRINGFTVDLPALRARTDFEDLVDHFLMREGGAGRRLTAEARQNLTSHEWRGNVRELEQVLRTAIVLSDGATEIGLEHLPHPFSCAMTASLPSEKNLLTRMTAEVARRTLRDHGGNVSAAARALGISRGTLYKKTRALA